MVSMSIDQLYKVGVSFESAVGEGTKEERARIPKNTSRINMTDEIIEEIQNINSEINFLVSGEIWCPDFQLNISILKKFCDLNNKFDMSIITMARGKKFLAPILELDEFKAPTVTVLNKDMEIIGVFVERPKKVIAEDNFEEIKLDYYKGKYLIDSINDFLQIMRKVK